MKLGFCSEDLQRVSSLDKEHFQANYEGLVYEWEPRKKERKFSTFKSKQLQTVISDEFDLKSASVNLSQPSVELAILDQSQVCSEQEIRVMPESVKLGFKLSKFGNY